MKFLAKAAIILALFLSLFLKIRFANLAYIIPQFMCLIIFYKCIILDAKLVYRYLFIYSLFEDIFQDLPIGSSLLCYFIFIQFLGANRRYICDRGANALLLGFSLSYCCFLLVKLIIFTATYGFTQISIISYFLELVTMICYYPWFHKLFNVTLKESFHE